MAYVTKLDWINVNADAMGATMKRKYLALKEAQQKARAAREDFELSFIAESKKAGKVEDGESLKFGYNFGRLAVAIVDESEMKPKKEAKGEKWF
jgi:hypothetical protein